MKYCDIIKQVKIKDAEYTENPVASYRGNPLIEGIKKPEPDDRKMKESYAAALPNYFRKDLSYLTRYDRRLQISELNRLRIPLTKQGELEMVFYRSLCESYVARTLRRTKLYSDDKEEVSLMGDPKDPTIEGFALFGYSGTGKSSTISIMLNKYDQVIRHRLEDGTEITQILYIVVNCKSYSNFKSLYAEIGKQVDIALGMKDFYEEEIKSLGSLGAMLSKVEKIIEKFAIGMIIFDEIELISFDCTKEASFQTLLTLANETKVGMSFIGTEEAYGKMFDKLKNTRRAGTNINFNEYLDDYNVFHNIMETIFEYQWFDKRQKLTEDIVKVFYEESRGIICLAILLYKYVTDNYLMAKRHFDITPEFVRETADDYFRSIRLALSKMAVLDKTQFNKALQKAIKDTEDSFDDKIDKIAQEKEIKEVVEVTKSSNENILVESATSLIRQLHDEYSISKIDSACRTIIKRNPSIDVNTLAKLAIKRLSSGNKSKKPTKEELQASLSFQ